MTVLHVAQSASSIFCFGHPLLDIQLKTDIEFVEKYHLNYGGYMVYSKLQEGIYEEMASNPRVSHIAGGSGLNSLRVIQALARRPGVTFYTGCVGNDKYAETLERLCIDEGVNVKFAISDQNHTGICGVAIVDTERSMCTSLGAALDFKLEHLKECWSHVESAKICYAAGFVLNVCFSGMLQIAKLYSESNRIFVTNLSAEFFVENYSVEMMQLMPYVDILFGNENEFKAFARVSNWGDAVKPEEIAVRISALPKSNQARPRIVVLTCGPLPTIVVCPWVNGGTPVLYPVPHMKAEEIVDTNAAGDAFVGGFLFAILKQMDSFYDEAADENHNSSSCNTNNSSCNTNNSSSSSSKSSGVPPVELDVNFCLDAAHMAAGHILLHEGCSFSFSKREIETFNNYHHNHHHHHHHHDNK